MHLGCGILNELLSTEDLLLYLNHESQTIVVEDHKKHINQKNLKESYLEALLS